MAEFRQCKRCHWAYMQEVPSVRTPPWTDDDAGLMFQACGQCGSVSIQKFTTDGGVSSVWMLTPDAMVMFRQGVPPATVSNYVFSGDFAKNRGITLPLFRGYLASMLDLSGFLNVIIARMDEFDDVDSVELCLDMIRDVVLEFLRREGVQRLMVSTLGPLVELMRAQRPLKGQSTSNRLDIRVRALEVLEIFVSPTLWRSAPEDERELIEGALDHQNMVDESVARMTAMSRDVDDAVLIDAFVESKFLYRLFRRRQARLSRPHANAVWRLMQAIDERYDVGSPLVFATRTFEALHALLEHQLVESGFFKLGKVDRGGNTFTRFKSPNTPEILAVPKHFARLEIYPDSGAREPDATLDSWTAALDRL